MSPGADPCGVEHRFDIERRLQRIRDVVERLLDRGVVCQPGRPPAAHVLEPACTERISTEQAVQVGTLDPAIRTDCAVVAPVPGTRRVSRYRVPLSCPCGSRNRPGAPSCAHRRRSSGARTSRPASRFQRPAVPDRRPRLPGRRRRRGRARGGPASGTHRTARALVRRFVRGPGRRGPNPASA